MQKCFLEWRSCRSNRSCDKNTSSPQSLYAACPPELRTCLPLEIALLLPIQKVSNPVPKLVTEPAHVAAALFMANPLLNVSTWSRYLLDRGIGWVSNFPSVTQHEQSFREGLSDVGLGPEKELALLSEFRSAGLRTLVCVTQDEDAAAAVADNHDALLVLPQVPAFEEGFPSVQYRERQLASIRAAISGANTPVLGLMAAAEAKNQSKWPKGMDEGLISPTSIPLPQV